MRLLLVGWSEIERLCGSLAGKVRRSGFRPDMIVCIGRGGWIPARIMADLLDVHDLSSMMIEFYKGTKKGRKHPVLTQPILVDVRGKRVLLVDDVVESGRTLALARKTLEERGVGEARSAVLHLKPRSSMKPDFSGKIVRGWVIYPWEKGEVTREFGKKVKA